MNYGINIKWTDELVNISLNIKLYSLQIDLITNLLKVTSTHEITEIIRHDDIRSIMKYQRYALSKDEIKNLLSKIEDK